MWLFSNTIQQIQIKARIYNEIKIQFFSCNENKLK